MRRVYFRAAYKIGLVQEVVPAGQQTDARHAGRGNIAKNAPIGIQVTKEAALKFIESGEQAAVDYIPKSRSRLHSEDFKEGIQSFVERRAAVFAANRLSARTLGCSTLRIKDQTWVA